jgi:hypothetical protein
VFVHGKLFQASHKFCDCGLSFSVSRSKNRFGLFSTAYTKEIFLVKVLTFVGKAVMF